MQPLGLLLLTVALGTPRSEPILPPDLNLNEYGEGGYLWSGYTRQNPGQPMGWKPQVGDLVFMTSADLGQTITYLIGRTTHPFHIAIVIRQSDGQLAILESGGGGTMEVTSRPILGRMGMYDMAIERRFAWVRRLKKPVTPEQSRAMTVYAEAQLGKAFVPYSRLAWFWIPGRPAPRQTTANQEKWFCSELVIAVMEAGGLLAPDEFRAGSATPRQLFNDCLWYDLSDRYRVPLPYSPTLAKPPVPGPKCAPYRAKE